MNNNSLLEKVRGEYKKVWWIKNYVKTVTASTLVGSGIGLIVTGELTRMHNHGWSNAEIILGATCVLLALIITLILDLWAKRKDEEVIETIEEHIEERAEQIAEQKVLFYLERIGEKNLKD